MLFGFGFRWQFHILQRNQVLLCNRNWNQAKPHGCYCPNSGMKEQRANDKPCQARGAIASLQQPLEHLLWQGICYILDNFVLHPPVIPQ